MKQGKNKQFSGGNFLKSFWKWNDLTSYVFALILFTILAAIVTAIFSQYNVYVETLGMTALLVEACLGLPQLFRNFSRKSVAGMSVKMVLMWLLGDIGKTIYFVVKHTPSQFYICGGLQITIDILILMQVFFYGRSILGIFTRMEKLEFME
uniref:PQ-loop repeat-containing protein 1 n=1 Tax=Ditylenchus dipsaci TaxID=166011 RepID=A0A915DGR2_9BILA